MTKMNLTGLLTLVLLFTAKVATAAEISVCQDKRLGEGSYTMANSRMTGERAQHELALMQSPYAHIVPAEVDDGLFSVTRYQGSLEKGELSRVESEGGCDFHDLSTKTYLLSRICDIGHVNHQVECFDQCRIEDHYESWGGGDCR